MVGRRIPATTGEFSPRRRVLLDEITDFVDFVFGELLIFGIEQGCDEVFRFSLEEGAQQTLEGGALGFSFSNGRSVEIASPFVVSHQ